MGNSAVNIMLIGLGAHAQRCYYPVYQRDGKEYNFRIAYVIDLEGREQSIESYLSAKNELTPLVHYFPRECVACPELSPDVTATLDKIVSDFSIKGVILATEPLAHMPYARWAIGRGLSVLVDKPISTHEDISTSQKAAEKIVQDYVELRELYKQSVKKYGRVLCSVMAQRRYHPIFQKTKALLKEVFERTNCPVTSIQSFHADGQWRLPAEIVDIDYHPFNKGYGKCSHSGYHFFDIVISMLEAAEKPGKRINNVDIFTNFLRPADFLTQLCSEDYDKLFADYAKYRKYNDAELAQIYTRYGEIDAFSSFAFKHDDRTITLGSINLAHNGFSQRGWLDLAGRDLYKGNGRLRHESHFIEQGPFQAISLVSYQSSEVAPANQENQYEVGGEFHFDIHVFRNSNLFPQWRPYEKITVEELSSAVMDGRSRGHQEDAKRQAVLEFAHYLNGEELQGVSDLMTHQRSVQLMSGVYSSAVKRYCGENPLVNIKF